MLSHALMAAKEHRKGIAVSTLALVALFACAIFVFRALDNGPGPGGIVGSEAAVDEKGPRLIAVEGVAEDMVIARFDEKVDPASVGTADFALGGVKLTGVSVDEDGRTVVLDVSAQTPGEAYTLALPKGAVADLVGNTNTATYDARFPGYGASGGSLLVDQGTGASRPRQPVAKRPSDVALVDQIHLTARRGDVTIDSISVRALSNADNIFSELVEAWLFADDGDGVFTNDGRDPQVALSVPFRGTKPGAPAVFDGLDYTILSGESRDLWIVYRLGNLAMTGRSVGSKVGFGDITLTAGRLEPHADIVSANGGRTLYVDADGPIIRELRVVDPTHVDVVFDDVIDPDSINAYDFLIQGRKARDAEVHRGGTAVRLTTSDILAPGSAVDVTFGGGSLTDLAGNPSIKGGSIRGFTPSAAGTNGDHTPPASPTNLQVATGTVSPTIATLTWTASSGDVGGGWVAGYRVWRSASATSGFESVGATQTPGFSDVSGVPGVPYYYRVTAYDDSGNESSPTAVVGPRTATWTPRPHATYGSGNLCAVCHTPHVAATQEGILRQAGSTATAGEIPICYDCHDGSGASNVKSQFTTATYPSGHALEGLVDTLPGALDLTNACSGCHGPHQDSTATPTLWRRSINGNTVTGNDNTWCLACHDSNHTWYKPGGYAALIASPTRDASGYPVTGTFPGRSIYTSLTANKHATATTSSLEAGSCRMCHDNHRSAQRYDMLLTTFRPSGAGTVLADRQNGTYAEQCIGACHDTDGPGANIKRHVTCEWDQNDSYAGHRIKSAGSILPVGAPLPCYDCHNPHGSSRGNKSMLSDALGKNLDTTASAGAEKLRQFCLTCHSTADATPRGYDASANVYVNVTSTMRFEGMRRDGGSVGDGPDGGKNWLLLKPVQGHYESDHDKSCYQCHGNKYEAGKNNVHDPGPGESAGGTACYSCHDTMTTMSTSNSTYHHVMSNDATADPVIADPATLTVTDTNRRCLVCHADHDVFNASLNPYNPTGRSRNLRANVATAPVSSTVNTYLDTDFDATSGGVCVSCHRVRMAKNETSRKPDASSTIIVDRAGYAGSSHNYIGKASTFTADNSTFRPNCLKCHDDAQPSQYQTGTPNYQAHETTIQSMLTAVGQSGLSEDPQEHFCYLCHSRAFEAQPRNPNGGATYTASGAVPDVYGSPGVTLDAASVNVKGSFSAASIVSSHPVGGVSPRVECANCHDTHQTGSPNKVVQDPANTLNSAVVFYSAWYNESQIATAARVNRDYCLGCHADATPPSAANTQTTYVPYSVYLSASQPVNPSRRTDNKAAFTSRSHFNTSVNGQAASTARAIDKTCADCHDPHSSTKTSLLGSPDRTTPYDILGTRYIYKDNATKSAVNGNDNTVCWACHDTASWTPATGSRTASGYPMTGRWPGKTAAETTYNATTHLGNPHRLSSALVKWPGREADYAANDCKNCHDVHGTGNPYDELRSDTAAGSHVMTYTPSSASFCFNCHDGDGPASKNLRGSYPASFGGTSIGEYAGHEITSTGGSLPRGSAMPCYECHAAHGSVNSAYGLLVVAQTSSSTTIAIGDDANEIKMSPADVSGDPVNVRKFCFSCHTSEDATPKGWNGSQMVTITAGAKVVGIDRVSTGSWLRLKVLTGGKTDHRATGTSNCYSCHGMVHEPVIPEPDKADCYSTGCHTGYKATMDTTGTNRTDGYHHVMGTASVLGDKPGGTASTYPTSTSELYCISCHADHDYFDPTYPGGNTRASNLRQSIGDSSGATRSNTDFLPSAPGNGVCVSCHGARLAKDTVNQKSDGTSWTPAVTSTAYDASAHDYAVPATFTADSTVFMGNCSKCHNDDAASGYGATRNFAVHTSAERNILAALGATPRDPLMGSQCLRCHSETGDYGKPIAGRDWYGATQTAMPTSAEKVAKAFSLGGSAHPASATASGSLACENCHNPHVVSRTTTQTDPDNNYLAAGYSTFGDRVAYCVKCHDGAPPKYMISDATYVASDVTMTAPKVNKDTAQAQAYSHWVTNNSIQSAKRVPCQDCHDKHGSKYDSLLGVYDAASGQMRVKTTTVTTNINSACMDDACHGQTGLGYVPTTPSLTDIAVQESYRDSTGYFSPTPSSTVTTVRWPGWTAWADVTVIAGDKRSPHFNTVTTYTPTGRNVSACTNCHDVHGGPNPYDELTETYAAKGAGAFDICFECHDGLDGDDVAGYAQDIKRFYPSRVGGVNPNEYAGHVIQTYDPNRAASLPSTGDPVPCYDCHGAHGSRNGNLWLLSDERWSSIADTSAATVRRFCLGCHVTTDGRDGEGRLLPLSDTQNLLEGFPRNYTGGYAYPNKLKVPPLAVSKAHESTQASGNHADSLKSCNECHGGDYSTADSFNVHNPSPGISNGGRACYNCHNRYQPMEDSQGTRTGPANTSYYHHTLGGTITATYYDGDNPSYNSAFPTSTTEVFCNSCHADHNHFNEPANKAANLRKKITSSVGSDTAASDFIASPADEYGICASCHKTQLGKDQQNQLNDGTTSTPRIDGATYTASAHQYAVQSEFSTSSYTFDGNCVKCHNDADSLKSVQTVGKPRFGLHYSAERRILDALGAALTDPMAERHCYGCHSEPEDFAQPGSKDATGYDYYGTDGAQMTGAAATEKTYKQFSGMNSEHPVGSPNGNGSVTACVSCHNVHTASVATPVVDPDDTYAPVSYATTATKVSFCGDCHDGTPPTAKMGAAYVPTTTVIGAGVTTKMNKLGRFDYYLRGHWEATGSISSSERVACGSCHDNHASNAVKLLGVYEPSTGLSKIGTQTITADDNTVCYGCHLEATVASAVEASGYPIDGTWPGRTTYESDTAPYDPVNHTGSFHTTATVIWPGKFGVYQPGDCKNCHDVHGTGIRRDELRSEDSIGQEQQYDFSPTEFTFCFNCHDTGDIESGPSIYNIKQFYPASAGGTGSGTRAGHAIQTTGTLRPGDALPCYDCHNPHGSRSNFGLSVKTGLAGAAAVLGDASGEITMGPTASDQDERNFCFACHTSSELSAWNGQTTVTVAPGSAYIEGIDRTAGKLVLPLMVGHRDQDADSCYTCHGYSYAPDGVNAHKPGVGTGGWDHLSTASDYENVGETGCINSGAGCHGTENNNMTVHTGTASCALPTACHNPTPGTSGTGYSDKRHECAECHDGYALTPDRVPVKDPFPNGHYSETTHTSGDGPSTITTLSASFRCDSCHKMGLDGEHRRLEVDPAPQTCYDCHTSDSAAVVANWGRPASTTCSYTGCHSSVGAGQTHTGEYAAHRADTIAANDGCRAAGCHAGTDMAAMHTSATVTIESTTYNSCNVCHRADYYPPEGDVGRTCSTCHGAAAALHHAYHSTLTTAIDPTFTTTSDQSNCTGSCHADYIDYAHGVDLSNPNTGMSWENTSSVGNGAAFACATCHGAPTGSPVKNAINNNDRRCVSCHTGQSGVYAASLYHRGNTNSGELRGANIFIQFQPSDVSVHKSNGISLTGATNGTLGLYYVNAQTSPSEFSRTSRTGVTQQQTWQWNSGLPSATNFYLRTGNGWTATSAVPCTGCHGVYSRTSRQLDVTQAADIGSGYGDARFYTATSYGTGEFPTNGSGTSVICGKCHVNYGANRAHANHSSAVRCVGCHVGVPHSSRWPRLNRWTTDTTANVEAGGGGITNYQAISGATWNDQSYSNGTCGTSKGTLCTKAH